MAWKQAQKINIHPGCGPNALPPRTSSIPGIAKPIEEATSERRQVAREFAGLAMAPYSSRSTAAGSMRVALRAGIQHARIVIANNRAIVAAKVGASKGWIPNSRVFRNRVSQTAAPTPPTPIPTPAAPASHLATTPSAGCAGRLPASPCEYSEPVISTPLEVGSCELQRRPHVAHINLSRRIVKPAGINSHNNCR
jgi:hypothetical protein